MTDTAQDELMTLSQQLLDSIDGQDWETYTRLCDPTLSAFEPEGVGHLIEGMAFHQFYFEMEGTGRAKQSTISSPNVRLLGDVAVISYIRLIQRVAADGSAPSSAFEETRVWQQQGGEWKHVHFHRSIPATV